MTQAPSRGPQRDYTRDDVRTAIEENFDDCEPFVTREIADALDCSIDTAFDRLDELHHLDEIEKKSPRKTTAIWWTPT